MLAKNWMSKPVITIDEDESMHEAIKKLKEHNIRILPVVKKETLVGIVTDRDLKRATVSDATTIDVHELIYITSNINVKQIMSKKVITVPFDFTIEETAEVLLNNKISGVPVVDKQGEMIGIISQSDIFKALISLTGVEKKGVQFAFQFEDKPGSIKEITDTIRKYGARIFSLLTTYEGAPIGYRNLYIRIFQLDRKKILDLQKELKKTTLLLYMIDFKENLREIF